MNPARRPAEAARFFASPAQFRAWLDWHHRTATEVLVGFHKVDTGRPSLTWSESVDVAICFGWIDGVRRSLGAEAYTIRFTPRRPRSIWSDVNTRKAQAMIAAGLMRPAGLAVFAARDEARAGVYAFERKAATLSPAQVATFKKATKAWRFWEAQPPGYRRTASHWVASAKRPETRAKRLATLIADSAAGLRIGLLRR